MTFTWAYIHPMDIILEKVTMSCNIVDSSGLCCNSGCFRSKLCADEDENCERRLTGAFMCAWYPWLWPIFYVAGILWHTSTHRPTVMIQTKARIWCLAPRWAWRVSQVSKTSRLVSRRRLGQYCSQRQTVPRGMQYSIVRVSYRRLIYVAIPTHHHQPRPTLMQSLWIK